MKTWGKELQESPLFEKDHMKAASSALKQYYEDIAKARKCYIEMMAAAYLQASDIPAG